MTRSAVHELTAFELSRVDSSEYFVHSIILWHTMMTRALCTGEIRQTTVTAPSAIVPTRFRKMEAINKFCPKVWWTLILSVLVRGIFTHTLSAGHNCEEQNALRWPGNLKTCWLPSNSWFHLTSSALYMRLPSHTQIHTYSHTYTEARAHVYCQLTHTQTMSSLN